MDPYRHTDRAVVMVWALPSVTAGPGLSCIKVSEPRFLTQEVGQ